jgi:GntR family transcriptional regulator, transcriptional repressor for pyruvate dehydrogenase complex
MSSTDTEAQAKGSAASRTAPRARRGVSLAEQLVERLTLQIRAGEIAPGAKLPTEAEIIASHGVSRTVVREALSRLSAAGLTQTHHGIGTFVREPSPRTGFGIDPSQMATMVEVLALLELRISMETEASALAALRRSEHQLEAIRKVLESFGQAISEGAGTVDHDFQFHLQIALATGNRYFAELMSYLGTMVIPRTRLNTAELANLDRKEYLTRVHREHQDIFDAIARQDPEAARAAMRTHLANSRERLRRVQEAAGAII